MKFSLIAPNHQPPSAPALQQHPAYGKTLSAIQVEAKVITVTSGAHTLAQAQIIRRTVGPAKLIWLPRGPVWSAAVTVEQKHAVLAGLPAAAGDFGLWLGVPESEADATHFTCHGYRPLLTSQHIAEIVLSRSRDERLTAQHGKWRNRLRHAQNCGLRVENRAFCPARDSDVLTTEGAQRSARRYTGHPPAFIHAWALVNPLMARLFTARKNNQVLAQMLVLLHPPTATYQIGWTNPEGRRYSAHNLLLWQAANWLADQGYCRFDLGSIDTENAPGLARFKIGSGAHVRPLGPTMLRLPGLRLAWSERRVA